MTGPIKVLLADDHPIYRKGIRAVLDDAGFVVVAEAEDGGSALVRMREHPSAIAILDLDMPVMDGLGVIRAAAAERLDARVIVMTGHKSEALINEVLDAGPMGFVLKDGALSEIVECVRSVHGGRRYVSPHLSSVVLARRTAAADLSASTPGLAALSPTERIVLARIAQGQTSREIAEALFVSVRTVEHHRAGIAQKLDLSGSNALVKFALLNRSSLV